MTYTENKDVDRFPSYPKLRTKCTNWVPSYLKLNEWRSLHVLITLSQIRKVVHKTSWTRHGSRHTGHPLPVAFSLVGTKTGRPRENFPMIGLSTLCSLSCYYKHKSAGVFTMSTICTVQGSTNRECLTNSGEERFSPLTKRFIPVLFSGVGKLEDNGGKIFSFLSYFLSVS